MLIGGIKKRLEMGRHYRKTIRSLISDIAGGGSCHRYLILYNNAKSFINVRILIRFNLFKVSAISETSAVIWHVSGARFLYTLSIFRHFTPIPLDKTQLNACQNS